MADDPTARLWSDKRMERERRVAELLEEAKATDIATAAAKMSTLVQASIGLAEEQVQTSDLPWERQHGGLLLCATLANNGIISDDLISIGALGATFLLDHKEARIREQAGLTLAALSKVAGADCDIYEKYSRSAIFNGIKNNLERQPDAADVALQAKLGHSGKPMGVEEILHQSAGWRTLETSSKALLEMAKAMGTSFAKHVNVPLFDLIRSSLHHSNRFVRETAYNICAEMAEVIHSSPSEAGMDPSEFDSTMAKVISTGLADNWSQVRMAASVAARKFMMSLESAAREPYYALFLPPTALNRYYVAEGVRLYNQATWRMIVGEEGKSLVERFIEPIARFYLLQADAANHAVREAACACIAELGLKVDRAAVQPYVPEMLAMLTECFRDESWPVRDAACIALGRFVSGFPEDARSQLSELYELFLQHVSDNIWSVRENAAVALAKVVKAYGNEAFAFVRPRLSEYLACAAEQPASSKKNAGLQNITTFGVAPPVDGTDEIENKGSRVWRPIDKRQEHDHDHNHNQQMYSCGSLAPKLKRKGGCMDCGYARPQEPWEKTDGAVYLVRELAPDHPNEMAALLPALATAAGQRHYEHHFHLLETIWKQLILIARAIGKRSFKAHLELFLEPLHYSLQCDNQLAVFAATTCIAEIGKLLGPSILLGRVENADSRYLDAFKQALSAPPIGCPI